MTDCREEKTNGSEEECKDQICCVGKIVSNSIEVTPRKDEGCDCYEVRLELKKEEEKECKLVNTILTNDVISLKRNGVEMCIKFSDLLSLLGCKQECL